MGDEAPLDLVLERAGTGSQDKRPMIESGGLDLRKEDSSTPGVQEYNDAQGTAPSSLLQDNLAEGTLSSKLNEDNVGTTLPESMPVLAPINEARVSAELNESTDFEQDTPQLVSDVDIKDETNISEPTLLEDDGKEANSVGIAVEDARMEESTELHVAEKDAGMAGSSKMSQANMAPGTSSSDLTQAEGQSRGTETTVKCAGCGKVFSQMCMLPQHANRRVVLSLCDDCENVTAAMFVCINCGQECSSLAALRAHKQTHVLEEDRVFVCEICGSAFHKQMDLEVHECRVSEVVNVPLPIIKKEAQSVPAVKTRSRRKRVRVEQIVSTLTERTRTVAVVKEEPEESLATAAKKPQKSPKQSQTPKAPRGRPKRKSGPVVKSVPVIRIKKLPAIALKSKRKPRKAKPKQKVEVKCPECFEIFKTRTLYKKHYRRVHMEREIFACDSCPKKFKSKYNFKRHQLKHLGVLEASNVCDICGKAFMTPAILQTHKNTVHSDEKPFECDICNKRFKQLGNMKTHRRTHTGEKPFICPTCGKKFSQHGNLIAHVVVHRTASPHVCDRCGKTFNYDRSLQNHIRGAHTGERPFACQICDKTFSNRAVLREHRRIHSDKKGYLCEKCGKGFKTYKNMKQHEKWHLDVRPYQCTVCGKSFVWHKSFSLHKRTHTGEKPYVCDQCDRAFTNINSLKNHKAKHLLGPVPPPKQRAPKQSVVVVPPTESSTPPSPQRPLSPGTALSMATQAMLMATAGMYSRQGREPEESSSQSHPHSRVSSASSSSEAAAAAAALQQTLPPHSQPYSHVMFPQHFSQYVSNPGGDFTVL